MSEAAVLFANEAFYRAFADRDAKAMDALWAEDAPVACIHPGWPALIGREVVMESWRRILGGGSAPEIVCHAPRALIRGDFAYVICYEAVGNQALVATNIFLRERGLWRLVHHQAGPSPGLPSREDEAPEPPPRPN